jgi:hypothetical protein
VGAYFKELTWRIAYVDLLCKFMLVKAQLIILYLKTNQLTVVFLSYMVGATLLKSYTAIDITFPCLIQYVTGHECYGCGLTTATAYLLKLDIPAAFEANALVFVVLPALLLMLIRHWLNFQQNQQG